MKLMELRKQRGVSREQVAAVGGVSLATVMRWEAGTAIPRADVARKVAEYFGVPESDIEWGVKSSDDDAGKGAPADAA